MPEHREHFDLNMPVAEAMLTCREAVAQLNWKVIDESAVGLVCREPQEVLSFNWAATVEITLHQANLNVTRITMYGRNFSWGRIQKNHLIGQIGNLRNKIASAAGRRNESGPARQTEDLSSELDRLADLHVRGVLTDEEFTSAKARLLGH